MAYIVARVQPVCLRDDHAVIRRRRERVSREARGLGKWRQNLIENKIETQTVLVAPYNAVDVGSCARDRALGTKMTRRATGKRTHGTEHLRHRREAAIFRWRERAINFRR